MPSATPSHTGKTASKENDVRLRLVIVALGVALHCASCNSSSRRVLTTTGNEFVSVPAKQSNTKRLAASWKIEKIYQVKPSPASISFAPNGVGFIGSLDQHFWMSHDGGRNWNESLIPSGVATNERNSPVRGGWYDLVRSFITASNHIYAIGHLEEAGSVIFTSIDGGTTWTSKVFPSSTLNDIESVENNVWLAGTIEGVGVILKQEKAGWEIIWKGKQGEYLEGVDFINTNLGWMVGAGGLVLRSFDGGHKWTAQVSPTRNTLSSVSFSDPENGFVVGGKGTILITNNGGLTWTESKSGTIADLTKVIAINRQQACAIGRSGMVLRTIDSGRTWDRYTLESEADVYGLALNGNDCWIAALDGNVYRLKSTK